MTNAISRTERKKRAYKADEHLFGRRLQEILDETNINKIDLEKDGIVSRPTLNAYLRGAKYPTMKNILLLSRYFDISADYLLGLTSIKQKSFGWTFEKGMWLCPFCRQAGEPNYDFCPSCGHKIETSG